MKNTLPIIITYEHHSDPASAAMRLRVWPTLFSYGYNCYVDEEAGETTLEDEQQLIQEELDANQELSSEEKYVLHMKQDLLKFLKENECTYVAGDLSLTDILSLRIISNLKQEKPTLHNIKKGTFYDFLEERNKCLCENIFGSSQKSGVMAIDGLAHAPGMQRYFEENFPDCNVMSVFFFSGPIPKDFENKLCNHLNEKTLFPSGIHRIDVNDRACRADAFLISLIDRFKQMMQSIEEGDMHRNDKQFSAALTAYQVAKKTCAILSGFNHQKIIYCQIRLKIAFCLLHKGELSSVKAICKRVINEIQLLSYSTHKRELLTIFDELQNDYFRLTKNQSQNESEIEHPFFMGTDKNV